MKNAPLIRYISALLDDHARHGRKVRLQYIKGHAGHEGNEGADMLAGQGAEMPEVEERDWQELATALRAKEIPQPREEIVEFLDISDSELEVGGCSSIDSKLRTNKSKRPMRRGL